MAADSTFQNRLYETNVGEALSDALPTGTYVPLSGELPPGVVVSPLGVVSGTPTTAGVYTMIMEYCFE